LVHLGADRLEPVRGEWARQVTDRTLVGSVPRVSPRHVPASVTELSRIGLFADLSGETLTKLADRMQREDVQPGTVLIREGEPGDRFFVLLSGVAGVTQSELGQRRVLKAGEFFGEVALTMRVPRTATVTAMTPCVVASCDSETFDELVRPLFADD
jgi:CRP-like cAMP-binding protein